MVNFPVGETFPVKTSAIAAPASVPPNHTFKIAFTCFSSDCNAKGLPVKSTITIGFPVFWIASSNFFCVCGISRMALLAPSPLISIDSPKAAIITSAPSTTFRASAINCSSLLSSRVERF